MSSRAARILHLVARSQRRGAEVVAAELAEELELLGFRNHVITLGPGTDGTHEADLIPLVDSRGMGPLDLARRIPKVRRLVVDDPVDVVLAHGGWAAQVAALTPLPGKPLRIWQRIGTLPPSVWRPPRSWWWERIAGRFDAVVALTAGLEAEMRRLRFDHPVWVIPNSRRPDRFVGLDRAAATRALRTEVGDADGVPLITFVGHLDVNKRPEHTIDVLARVLRDGIPAHLVVAGDGLRRTALEQDVRSARGLERSVTFLGNRSDVERVLGGSELLLITSESEGIPGVAIEALMAGCPVVTYPVGAVSEVVDDGVTGIVLARSDVELMADAVTRLLGHPEDRAALSDAGRLQTARFSSAAVAARLADHLVGALDAR